MNAHAMPLAEVIRLPVRREIGSLALFGLVFNRKRR